LHPPATLDTSRLSLTHGVLLESLLENNRELDGERLTWKYCDRLQGHTVRQAYNCFERAEV